MMGTKNGVFLLFGILLAIYSAPSLAQTKRSSRITSSRTFGINVKSSSSSGVDFDCPEEFGYYPHPSDCTQYYVCVFGGALLESCTGGLMYSHELQTCDWPRNVGCEVAEISPSSSSSSASQASRDIGPRVPQIKQQLQQAQQVPSRVRFSSIPTAVGQQQSQRTSDRQQHQQHQQQHRQQIVQAQIQTIPPPPELRVAPNPIITSRGQPKPILDSQEDIAKLYAEAHDTLPPAEEEETDRQQRVYRGQPSTVGQVQRDRDGIIHQANANALPNHGKVGSYAFGPQTNQFSDEIHLDIDVNSLIDTTDSVHLNRRRRETGGDIQNLTDTATDSLTEDSLENSTFYAEEFGKKNDNESNGTAQFFRTPRQLRTSFTGPHSWQFQNGQLHSLQRTGPKSFKPNGHFDTFSPYLSPPAFSAVQFSKTNNNFFNKPIRPGLNNFAGRLKNQPLNDFKPSNFFNFEQKPPLDEPFRPFNPFFTTTTVPPLKSSMVIPNIIDSVRNQQIIPTSSRDIIPNNFSFFKLGSTSNRGQFSDPVRQGLPSEKVTPKNHFTSFSTIGGFFNNNNNNFSQPTNQGIPTKVPKIISHFSITPLEVNTESNYFAYNVLQNQKMKNYYSTSTTTQNPTTLQNFPFVGSSNYFSKAPLEEVLHQQDKHVFKGFGSTSPRITGFYITTPSPKTTTTTRRPLSSKSPLQTRPKIQGPVVGLDFDFDKFVADIRETHIAQMDPKIFEMLDLFKKKVIFNKTTISSLPTTTERTFEHKIIPQTTPKIVTNNFFYDHANKNVGSSVRHTTIKTSITTTAQKPPKGYDSFIKSIPQKISPVTETDQKNSQDTEQYSSEEDDEYYYDDDEDEDYDIHPPSEKPPYMPNSETMAPKPHPITTTPRYKNHHSTFTEVTTTRRPQVFSSHYNDDKHKIPSFISFPSDIFQSIAPMRPATTTPATVTMTTTPPTISPYENYEISKISTTSPTPTPTAASTTRKVYTIRPNRGNLKWKLDKTDKPNSRKRPVQQQIQVDDKYTNRVETSSQAPANIFIQQRQKPVAEQSTRNYYNTSNQSYDPYDSYYSVYDDDVDLYRDVEYTQQQQRGKPQQQSTYRPEVNTTPSPQVPVRETYVTKSQVQQIQTQQEQQYNQPSLVYNTDYEDALIAQIESDDYSQPQRNQPIRGDRIEINSITDRPIVISSTLRTSDQPKYTPATYAPTIHQKQPQQQSTSQKKSHSPKPIPTRASEQYSIVPTQQSANPQPPKQTPTRSTLSEDGINNKTTKSIIITLSASAGPKSHQSKTPPLEPEPTESLVSSTPDYVSHVRNVEILKESQTKAIKQTDLTPKTVTNDENKSKIISLSAGFSATSSRPSTTNTTTKAFRDSRGRGAANREVTDQDEQKKRILSFIVSDVEPQSFQPPPKTPEIPTTTQRTIRVSPAAHIPEDVLKGQKSIRISLTSGLGGLSSSTQSTRGSVEEVPIYTRTREDLKRGASIEPTTYAPTRSWRLTRTSPSPFATQDTNYLAEFGDSREADSSFSFKRQRLNDYVSGSGSEHTPVTERGMKGDKIQSFTTRALVFKDNLSKAYDTTSSSKFVSPYKSLETILQEKESKLKLGTSKTTLKPRYTTPTASTVVVTSQKPFRSYFLITAPPKNISTTSTTVRYSVPPSTTKIVVVPTTATTTTTSTTTTTTTTTTSTTPRTTASTTTTTEASTSTAPPTYRPTGKRDYEAADVSPRGRARYTYSYVNNLDDEPTTYSPKIRFTVPIKTSTETPIRRKVVRTRLSSALSTTISPSPLSIGFSRLFESRGSPRVEFAALKSEPSEIATEFRAEEQGYSEEANQEEEQGDELSDLRNLKLIDSNIFVPSSTEGRVVEITERPVQYIGKVAPPVEDANQNVSKFRATVEMPEFNVPTEEEIRAYTERESLIPEEPEELEDITKWSSLALDSSTQFEPISSTTVNLTSSIAPPSTSTTSVEPSTSTNYSTTSTETSTTTTTTTTTARTTQKPTTKYPKSLLPPRASRVNNAIKSSIAASSRSKATTALSKCADNTPNTKCNEIPSRTNTRNRGGTHYANNERDQPATANAGRGTHPPRSRPTLKPSGTIVSKAAEFVDIYKYPPFRPEPIYPTPTPDKTAAKCRKDVCLLPDCYCGGKEVPGDLPVESIPQIVLLTFDDSVNDLNKQLYTDLFEKGRVNPNGCPITATFYVSHEWTDYSQVQNLYADGHEMASHTVSHSFGEQFSQKKWTREVAGQREILAAYGGVKLADVRGMRAPFLSIGGNKMFKMLYDSNFTYDSSMPVYENRPPSWPYTLDYKIFHDCMIPPCPTKSYPGVWEVPMVMWQDLNGGRCSMGDACSNPAEADGVYKMLMKNFERHYTSNRAPFGLFYHAAWFTQPHHKEGFIHFLDTINAMNDVWIVTNWQALQWVRDPTPLSRINQFQPFQCDYSDRPKRCNSPKVCNLWHKSGVRYMRTCQPCPDIYPWTGKTGIRSSRVDNDIEE